MQEVVVKKPWGEYVDLYRSNKVVFKQLTINVGERISYQQHNARSEYWFIAEGSGTLKFSVAGSPLEEYSVAKVNTLDTIEIPSRMAHQIINNGSIPLIIYEMQSGDCSEADIVRLEDPYKRV